MLSLFSRSRYGPIGLDVGAEGIRLLQLGRCGGTLSVASAARWHFPQDAQAQGADRGNRTSLAAQAVCNLLKKARFHGREVVSCLRGEELAVKNVRLPQMPDQELSQAIVWESQERFGFPVCEDRIHYFNAGEVRQGPEVRDEIVVMAVREESVRQHLEMLEQMHLKPLHLDAEPTALLRAYLRLLRRAGDASTVSVIVDIGLASTKVIVARGQTVLLIKSIDVAGRKLNESVAKELGLSSAEAGHLRRRTGEAAANSEPPSSADAVEWSVFDAIRGQVEKLAREISLCLRYCSVTFRGLRPDQITLSGGEAYDPALVKLLGEYLDRPCVLGQPLRGIELGQVDLGSDRRGELTEWSVATGLALRGLVEDESSGKADHARSRIPA
jgi:type IV pilus assembly protein PilM